MFSQKVVRAGFLLPQRGAGLRPMAMTSMQNQLRRLCLSSTSNPRPQLQAPLVAQLLTRSNSSAATATKEPKAPAPKKASAKPRTPKKASAKPSADKKKKKKPLTEVQQKAKEAREYRERIKHLKAVALTPPKRLPEFFRNLATQLKGQEITEEGLSNQDRFRKVAEIVNNLSTHEKQQITEQAAQNRLANDTAYEAFINSHTPLEIKEANKARKTLARLENQKRIMLLADARQLKKPASIFMRYTLLRYAANDLPASAVTQVERVKIMAEDYKNLSPSKKEELEKEFAEEVQQYYRDYEQVYGIPCPTAPNNRSVS